MHFDPTNNISWQLGYRGRVAVFIDGNNLFHAARFHNIDIDYNKLLRVLLGDGRLLRAFFYTGVDVGAERQQGFLLWMRRNGFRVIHKELKTFYDGTRKANLDVEIAVDMLSLAGRYDTAVLVSGDEDFVYAVNAVAYKGCRVEVAGFRSNTAPKLIDVADYFIDLGEIADKVRKETSHGSRYYEHHQQHEAHNNNNSHAFSHAEHAPPQRDEHVGQQQQGHAIEEAAAPNGDRSQRRPRRQEAHGGVMEDFQAPHVMADAGDAEEAERFNAPGDFIRVTDDQ
ncbi:MAG TPA: NYN domain-containing protein [Pyrinomonadaceae bacterium]|nr:NYN domain-containing protein [Pyrinomonadaceae bacterium]